MFSVFFTYVLLNQKIDYYYYLVVLLIFNNIMIATQVLNDTQVFEDDVASDSESDVVGFLDVEGKEFVVKKGENKIGRDPSLCTIVLESVTVSKVHAVIESDGIDETFIYDAGSTNQTKLGKKILKPHCRYKIDCNVKIILGNVVAEFKTDIKAKSFSETTLLYSNEKNKRSVLEYTEDIFELSTQIDPQPSTSKALNTSEKSEQIFKVPEKKTQASLSDTSQNCLGAETQCQMKHQESLPSKGLFINKAVDVDIFNLSTQCPISTSSLENLLKKTKYVNEELFNDGHDEILGDLVLEEVQNEKISQAGNISKSTFDEPAKKETISGEIFSEPKSNESFLDISLEESECLIIPEKLRKDLPRSKSLKSYENCCSNTISTQNKQFLVVNEDSDEETQIYLNEEISEKNVEEDEVVSTQLHSLKSTFGEKTNKNNTKIFYQETQRDDFTVGECENKNKNFLSVQLFNKNIGKKDKSLQANEKKMVVEEQDTSEDFLATQTFLEPIVNKEKLEKVVSENGKEIGDCDEDLLATQIFPQIIEKPKNEIEENVACNTWKKNDNFGEDILATQLFPDSSDVPVKGIEDSKSEKVDSYFEEGNNDDFLKTVDSFTKPLTKSFSKVNKKLSPNIVENPKLESEDFLETQIFASAVEKSPLNTKENCEDFLETQVFEMPAERTYKNHENCVAEDENYDTEDFLATQIFDSVEKQLKEKKTENARDFLETQVFEGVAVTESHFQMNSPDLLSEREEGCSEDCLRTQTFIEKQLNPSNASVVNSFKNQEETVKPLFLYNDSGDETESDLDIIYEGEQKTNEMSDSTIKCEIFCQVEKNKDSSSKNNSSDESYVFEIDDSEKHQKILGKEIRNSKQKEKKQNSCSSDDSFWGPLSLQMPCTQDIEKTVLTKSVSSSVVSKNSHVEHSIKRQRNRNKEEEDIIPFKKCKNEKKTLSNSRSSDGEKRLSKLWQTHDISEVLTSRTRRCTKRSDSVDTTDSSGGKTPTRKCRIKTSLREGLAVEKKPEISSKSSSPEVKPFKRVLRSTRSLKSENLTSNTSETPNKKYRKTSRRKKKDFTFESTGLRVVFTGFDCKVLDKIIRDLKGEKSYTLGSSDVIVTDRVRRTVKFLCAIGLGLPIASPDWLLTSKKEKQFLNPWNFILKDKESEEKWGFNLENSLDRARKHKFLSGMSVYATAGTKPPPEDLLDIVESCGGIPLHNRPKVWPKKTLIASCLEDKECWPLKISANFQIVHYECILSGVLRQKLDIRTFKLK